MMLPKVGKRSTYLCLYCAWNVTEGQTLGAFPGKNLHGWAMPPPKMCFPRFVVTFPHPVTIG